MVVYSIMQGKGNLCFTKCWSDTSGLTNHWMIQRQKMPAAQLACLLSWQAVKAHNKEAQLLQPAHYKSHH